MADEPNEQPRPTITPRPNGSLKVTGLELLTDWRGNPIEHKPTFALCRCGASENKPFCDGSHKKIGFNSDKLTDSEFDSRENYQGKQITVHDNRGICSHAGFCTDGLPKVWRMKVEPWIDPDGEGPPKIIETIRRCPSGALSYSIDDAEHRDEDRPAEIRVSKDGPLWVRGGVALEDTAWGVEASKEHYTLCRCGHSKNKPFCDGQHWSVEFKDPVVVSEAEGGELNAEG